MWGGGGLQNKWSNTNIYNIQEVLKNLNTKVQPNFKRLTTITSQCIRETDNRHSTSPKNPIKAKEQTNNFLPIKLTKI